MTETPLNHNRLFKSNGQDHLRYQCTRANANYSINDVSWRSLISSIERSGFAADWSPFPNKLVIMSNYGVIMVIMAVKGQLKMGRAEGSHLLHSSSEWSPKFDSNLKRNTMISAQFHLQWWFMRKSFDLVSYFKGFLLKIFIVITEFYFTFWKILIAIWWETLWFRRNFILNDDFCGKASTL